MFKFLQLFHACSVTQLCLTLRNPKDYSLPGSSLHGILQKRILEWLAILCSGSSQPRDWTHICGSCIGRQILYPWASWEAPPIIWYVFIYIYIFSESYLFYWRVFSLDIELNLEIIFFQSFQIKFHWLLLSIVSYKKLFVCFYDRFPRKIKIFLSCGKKTEVICKKKKKLFVSLIVASFFLMDFPCSSAGKESACNTGDLGSIPGLGRSPGEGKGYPLWYSGLENSMDCMYSPWGHKEPDMTEWLSFSFFLR